jgi:hypothetical protein
MDILAENDTINAIGKFKLAQHYHDLGHKLEFLIGNSGTSSGNYYTGEIEDNLNAMKYSLDRRTLREIAESSGDGTSIGYMFRTAEFDIVLLEAYSDGSVFIAVNRDQSEIFNDDIPPTYNETLCLEYNSPSLCQVILSALLATDSDVDLEPGPMGNRGSLEYINITKGGSSYCAYGYNTTEGKSIFGASMQNIVTGILVSAFKDGSRISKEQILSITGAKDIEVGNTSLTNFRWAGYYYEFAEWSVLK